MTARLNIVEYNVVDSFTLPPSAENSHSPSPPTHTYGTPLVACFISEQDWRALQAYADAVDDAFQLQYGLASTTQRYMSKWALAEVLGLMHRYLQVGSAVFCFRAVLSFGGQGPQPIAASRG